MNQKISALILLLVFAFFGCQNKAENKTDVDNLQEITEDRVFDQVGILSDSEKKSLTSLIQELEKKIGSQIVVLIIDSLNGERIEDFSIRTAEAMKIGRSKYNDGVLILQSFKDRELRIEVGLGLEKILRDEIVARIVRDMMAPKFKEAKYYEGLHRAVAEIKDLIERNKDFVGQAP